MRKILLLAAPVVAMAGLAWAWQEGGKEQKHEMEKPTKEHLSLRKARGPGITS